MKRTFWKFATVGFLLVFSASIFAQNGTIQGTVKSEVNDELIPGVFG